MGKCNSQNGAEVIETQKPAKASRLRIGRPVKVTADTTTEEVTVSNGTDDEPKTRLSADIPHSSYIALKTYAATVKKNVNFVVNELLTAAFITKPTH